MKITLNLDETWANEETISTAVMDALHATIRVEVQRIVKQMMKEHEAAIAGVAKRDYAKAAALFRRAADQQLDDAQCQLGVLYANGQGVPQDYAEALAWYRKAAEQGHAEASPGKTAHRRDTESSE